MKAALEALTTIVNGSFDHIKDFQAEIEEFAYQATSVREELICEVDLGIGVYRKDRGARMRLAAYYLLESISEHCRDFDIEKHILVIAK